MSLYGKAALLQSLHDICIIC